MSHADVVIIGAGAAGLMCAIEAGKRGWRVLLIEHCDRVGKKILISGGGRCNFTNLHITPENFLSNNPHFCKSALARYTPSDFIAMVECHGISCKRTRPVVLRSVGEVIVKMLTDECRQANVRIVTDCRVVGVARGGARFQVQTSRGMIQASSLVVACGGLSVLKMGASGLGYEIAKQFGHPVVSPRQALVPFIFDAADMVRYGGLSGVSLPVRVECGRQIFSNTMLFTHRGVSGPAILQISSYWNPGDDLSINFLPLTDADAWLRKQQASRSDAELKTVLSEFLPKRLAQRLCEIELGNRPLRQYTARDLAVICARLQNWRFGPSETEGYRTAEVTLGGVDTDEL